MDERHMRLACGGEHRFGRFDIGAQELFTLSIVTNLSRAVNDTGDLGGDQRVGRG